MAISKANKAVTRARTVLIVSQAFYGALALQLELVEDDGKVCDTMAVDGKHMFYNPAFVLSITEEQLVGVVAHEVSHCSYKHMTRRGHRDHGLWNIAGDYVINQDLLDAGFKLPGKPSHTVKPGSNEKIHLIDPKFRGMSTEEVYERLLQQATKVPMGGGSGNGDGKCQDPGGCGGVIDATKANDKIGHDQIDSEWEANVRMAVAVATAANAGKLPGHLERLVKQLKQPKISWKDKTRRFIDNSMIKDFSWARPNRRSVSAGVLLPGYIADRMHHLVAVVDVSGSISNDMMIEMVSECGGALDEGVADKLTVIYADDGVRQVDEFQYGELVTARTMGGGGTDFTDSFRYIRENCPEASCVIYLTDMCTCGWGEDPGCPVLWAAFLHESSYSQIAGTAPFGEAIHVPR